MLRTLRRLAKKWLAVPWVRSTKEAAERGVSEVFGANRVLSHGYHTVVFLPFNREQFAVLRGKRDYYRNQRRTRTTHVELRRNIHRLEKGMIMQPRRDVFARDYIAETIEFYERAVDQCSTAPDSIDPGEVEWASDVLTMYFAMVAAGNDTIDAARRRFESLTAPGEPGSKVPYRKVDGPQSDITYDQMLTLARQRRSVRWFEDRPVDRDLVDKALLVARQAPTACNRLPYEFRIFDDPAQVATVAGLPFGAAGYAHNIPTIVVVVGKLDSFFSARDRHGIYIDASLAVMSFLFALETLGLSSSVINWPDFEPLEQKMAKTLGLDATERVVMLVAVGHGDPDGLVPWSEKKSLDTLRSYNDLP